MSKFHIITRVERRLEMPEGRRSAGTWQAWTDEFYLEVVSRHVAVTSDDGTKGIKERHVVFEVQHIDEALSQLLRVHAAPVGYYRLGDLDDAPVWHHTGGGFIKVHSV